MPPYSYTPQPPALETAVQYAKDVLDGNIVACNFIKLAAKRFLDDLLHQDERDFEFSEDAADKAVRFFGCLRHTKGRWAKKVETSGFVLAPWQVFIIANLFGWLIKADGQRRYREAHIEVARKNGKSTFIAGIGLYMLFADGEPGAEVYSAATTKDQAKIVFDAAQAMVKASPALAGSIVAWRNNLHIDATSSKFEPLSADAETLDGLNIHCALIDELHEHPTRALYDVLNTATGSRSQPGIYAITTAGFNREGICWSQREYGSQILRGVTQDDKFFVFIATLDDGDDWQDERNWIKANPNLGVSISLEALRPNFVKAKAQPAALNEFLRKHMNVWTTANTSWLAAGAWDKNCGYKDIDPKILRINAFEQLRGRRCFAGLDLAESEDICALVLIFPPCPQETQKIAVADPDSIVVTIRSTGETKTLRRVTAEQLISRGAAVRAINQGKVQREEEQIIRQADNKWSIVPFFWIPGDFVDQKEEKHRVPYQAWIRSGFIETCPGNLVNQELVRKKILELYQTYRLIELGYDKMGAEWIGPKLKEDGLKVIAIPPFFVNMSQPTKLLSNLLGAGLCEHYNNPVLRWHVDNVELQLDHEGNQKPDKSKSRNKIDGAVATVLAVSRSLANPQDDNPDKYKVRYI